MKVQNKKDDIRNLINTQLKIINKFPSFADNHHFYGLLKEEIEEAEDCIKIISDNFENAENFITLWKTYNRHD